VKTSGAQDTTTELARDATKLALEGQANQRVESRRFSGASPHSAMSLCPS
jgi:hypothetical protein